MSQAPPKELRRKPPPEGWKSARNNYPDQESRSPLNINHHVKTPTVPDKRKQPNLSNMRIPPHNRPQPPENRRKTLENGLQEHRRQFPENMQYPPEHRQQFPENRQYPPEHERYPAEHRRQPPENKRYPPEHRRQSPEYEQYPHEHRRQFPENRQYPAENRRQSPEHERYPAEHRRQPPENRRYSAEHRRQSPENERYPTRHRRNSLENERYPRSNVRSSPARGRHSSATVRRPPPVIQQPTSPYTCSELLDALKAIQQVAQCCSCNKPLLSARTCFKGHGLCSTCKNRNSRICPLCDSPIPNSKPLLLNDILKLLPRKCKNNEEGCDYLVIANNTDHEKFCRFRKVSCRFLSCGEECLAKDLLRHIENRHSQDVIRTSSHSQLQSGFDASIQRKGLLVVVAFNNIIWQHVKVGNNCLLQLYQYVPMEKPRVNFAAKVKFHTPETSYMALTPVHTDEVDPEQLFNEKKTFCLPEEYADSFKSFYGSVNYSFEIVKSESLFTAD